MITLKVSCRGRFWWNADFTSLSTLPLQQTWPSYKAFSKALRVSHTFLLPSPALCCWNTFFFALVCLIILSFCWILFDNTLFEEAVPRNVQVANQFKWKGCIYRKKKRRKQTSKYKTISTIKMLRWVCPERLQLYMQQYIEILEDEWLASSSWLKHTSHRDIQSQWESRLDFNSQGCSTVEATLAEQSFLTLHLK